jgi:hypothetical protein
MGRNRQGDRPPLALLRCHTNPKTIHGLMQKQTNKAQF